MHPGGSLFKGSDILRTVRTGQVAIGAAPLGMHSAEEPLFGLTHIPFLVTTHEQAALLNDLMKPYLDVALAKRNLKLLYTAVWTPQGLFSAKSLQKPEDLLGMRIRTYDAMTSRFAQLVGAIPTKTEFSEVSLAFSTGVVEGSFASGATGVSQKLWDYIDYYYRANVTYPVTYVVVNLNAWNNVDTTTQSTVLRIASNTERSAWAEMASIENSDYSTMQAQAMELPTITPELASYFNEIGEQIALEWQQAGGEGVGRIIEQLR